MREFDDIIVGQGLAGTTLAWRLIDRDRRVLVIDRADSGTSSRLAAGLMTPVTGQRLTVTWRHDDFWQRAIDFYRGIESRTNESFLHDNGAVRLFLNGKERETFARRQAEDELFASLVSGIDSLPAEVPPERDGFSMRTAARLDVPGFLDASRREFSALADFAEADLDVSQDIVSDERAVQIPRLNVAAKQIVFCQGIAAAANPWFRGVEFDATRGELLTLHIPELDEQRTIHCGVWLAALGSRQFRVGATSRWDRLDEGPTVEGRDWLCSRLHTFLNAEYDVVGHDSGVRPIVKGRHPLIGRHPTRPRLAYFNGLGSKGSLQAPLMSELLARHLVDDTPIDATVDLNQRTDCRP
ncbi:MAG: NAD(P)/FAD-dependent oxidoreductase [Planctomycetota bacterium]